MDDEKREPTMLHLKQPDEHIVSLILSVWVAYLLPNCENTHLLHTLFRVERIFNLNPLLFLKSLFLLLDAGRALIFLINSLKHFSTAAFQPLCVIVSINM